MSNDPQPGGGFRIRRVGQPAPAATPATRGGAPPPQATPAPPPQQGAPAPAAIPLPATGARFVGPGGVLSFLGAVFGMGLAREAGCRRSPDSKAWWAEVDRDWQDVADLAWAAGGVPFRRDGRTWRLAQAGAEGRTTTLDVSAWPEVEMAELLAGSSLRPGPVPDTETIAAIMPGPLAGWVVRRAIATGLTATLVTARRAPLAGGGQETGALLVRLRAQPGRTVPRSLIQAMNNLPDVVVGRPVGLTGDGLIVDVRCRLPMGESMLAGMLPPGEAWVLGPPEVGHMRLRLAGEEVDGAAVLALPSLPGPKPIDAPAAIPVARPVRVAHRTRAGERVDAVLVDDEELKWLREYLPHRPAGELAFVLLGPGRHLLTGPGGLTSQVPFGTPMMRLGPGGLYIETGMDFDPPLPPEARRKAFGAGKGIVVAVTEAEVYRFRDDHLMPAWSLWLGEPPAYKEGLSRDATELLRRLTEVIRQAEAAKAPKEERGPVRPATDEERQRLLDQAMRMELEGDLVGAAGALERAGQMARAGRLYERAARERM